MTFARNTLAGLCLLALAACGGSSDTPSSATLTVTPSLGKVLGATVRLRDLQGTLLAQGFLGTEGSVELDFATLPSGFVVELVGGEDIWYFDEGIGGYRPLAEGEILHAVSAGKRDSITVTAFTELMYQRALILAGGSTLTAAHIAQAEADVQALLDIAAGNSLLDVPEILDSPLDLPSTDTWAGQQAGLLAAFSRLALLQPHDAGGLPRRSRLRAAARLHRPAGGRLQGRQPGQPGHRGVARHALRSRRRPCDLAGRRAGLRRKRLPQHRYRGP